MPFVPQNMMPSHGSPFPLLKFQMASRLRQSQHPLGPSYVSVNKGKAWHSHRTPQEPSFVYPSGTLAKEPSIQVLLTEFPQRETLHFQSPLLLSLDVPSKQTSPPGPPLGPLWGEIPISRAFFYTLLRALKKKKSPDITKSHLSLKVPGQGALPPCSPIGASTE